MLITIIECKEPATKNLSDLRAASDLRDLNIWYLNEFPYSQTVRFDFGHKKDAIDLQWKIIRLVKFDFGHKIGAIDLQ